MRDRLDIGNRAHRLPFDFIIWFHSVLSFWFVSFVPSRSNQLLPSLFNRVACLLTNTRHEFNRFTPPPNATAVLLDFSAPLNGTDKRHRLIEQFYFADEFEPLWII